MPTCNFVLPFESSNNVEIFTLETFSKRLFRISLPSTLQYPVPTQYTMPFKNVYGADQNDKFGTANPVSCTEPKHFAMAIGSYLENHKETEFCNNMNMLEIETETLFEWTDILECDSIERLCKMFKIFFLMFFAPYPAFNLLKPFPSQDPCNNISLPFRNLRSCFWDVAEAGQGIQYTWLPS